MKRHYKYALSCLVFLSFLSLSFHLKEKEEDVKYIEEVNAWHKKRIANLKGESGWLNLAGLFWLKEGKNSFGSEKDNDIVFPEGKIALEVGDFDLANGEVTMHILDSLEVSIGQSHRKEASLYPYDNEENPIIAESNSLKWFVIKRSEKYAIRLRDLESPLLKEFKGIDRFPIQSIWKVKAFMEKNPSPFAIPITDVTGLTTLTPVPGTLTFVLKGQTVRLLPTKENGKLFIIFSDASNGDETYPSGRFLYADLPDSSGMTTLDFNKSYNPPCAFTAYATCPLPPSQNFLPMKITAGEKMWGEGNH